MSEQQQQYEKQNDSRVNENQQPPRRVCVVGAGTAGLCALRHTLSYGMDVVAYEQSSEVGGTWVYSDNTNALYEEDVQSSMYEGLYTNLPKEVMGYPDYKYPETIEDSFISSSEVLKFLQSYTEHFKLSLHIKFKHEVIRVRPWRGQWEVYVWDKVSDKYSVELFDFMFICNGHYTHPTYPEIEGMDVYTGKQMHSHLYRKASTFKDETVLVIGCGPSGIDITDHIRKTAKHVYISHHLSPPPNTAFMKNVTQKPDIERLTKTGAIFKDGSTEYFSNIIYCTGYYYTFPFLSCDCGIRVRDNFVQPLYKHCINIRYPSMAFIGLPFFVIPTQLFDLQVRFALKFFSGQRELPNAAIMREDFENEVEERKKNGLKGHQMGERQFDYYKNLCDLADIENIKPVIGKMMMDCHKKYIYQLDTYRTNRFKIIDDENFVKFTATKSE